MSPWGSHLWFESHRGIWEPLTSTSEWIVINLLDLNQTSAKNNILISPSGNISMLTRRWWTWQALNLLNISTLALAFSSKHHCVSTLSPVKVGLNEKCFFLTAVFSCKTKCDLCLHNLKPTNNIKTSTHQSISLQLLTQIALCFLFHWDFKLLNKSLFIYNILEGM